MGWKFLARASSLFALLLLACAAHAQTFGRFGYSSAARVPGWSVEKEGFKAKHPAADLLQFPSPASSWTATVGSSSRQTIDLGSTGPGGPIRIETDLAAPGFSLFFKEGIDLKLTVQGAPFLSWTEGTVAQRVPTPASQWVLLSFRTEQPPVLFVFHGSPVPLMIEGEPGNWHLKSQAPFEGGVRVLLPLANASASPSNAAGLGALSAKITKLQSLWMGESPKLLSRDIATDQTAVIATWTYDRPGVMVPVAAVLATFGGYNVQILSKIARLEGIDDEGPVELTAEPVFRVRFPIKPFPSCRFLPLGDMPIAGFQSPLNLESAVEAGLLSLGGPVDAKTRADAGASLVGFLSSSAMQTETVTGQRLPYAEAGTGYALTTAHAFLAQALASASGAMETQNPLLSSVQARIDAYTWRPWGVEESESRRALALGALAFAMRSDSESRLYAGMMQAGLSAQRGYGLWRRWRGEVTKLPETLEPMLELRRALFNLSGPAAVDDLTAELFSPIRVCTGPSVSAIQKDGRALLTWVALNTNPSEIELSTKLPIRFGAGQNLQAQSVEQHGDSWIVRFTPKDVGACSLELILPPNAPSLPAAVAPKYVEVFR